MALQKRKSTQSINRGKKLATFVFMYQSIGVLQVNGIAQAPAPLFSRIPSTDPSISQKREMSVIEVDDNDYLDSDEEVKELVFLHSRVRQLEKNHANLKRVKIEMDSALLPGEVMDLMEDN